MQQLELDTERDENQLTLEQEERSREAQWGDIDANGDLLPITEAA